MIRPMRKMRGHNAAQRWDGVAAVSPMPPKIDIHKLIKPKLWHDDVTKKF